MLEIYVFSYLTMIIQESVEECIFASSTCVTIHDEVVCLFRVKPSIHVRASIAYVHFYLK